MDEQKKSDIPVEVNFAPVWCCPICNEFNIAPLIPADDMDDEAFETMVRIELELDPWESIPEYVTRDDFAKLPSELGCGNCGHQFYNLSIGTADDGEEFDEEDDCNGGLMDRPYGESDGPDGFLPRNPNLDL